MKRVLVFLFLCALIAGAKEITMPNVNKDDVVVKKVWGTLGGGTQKKPVYGQNPTTPNGWTGYTPPPQQNGFTGFVPTQPQTGFSQPVMQQPKFPIVSQAPTPSMASARISGAPIPLAAPPPPPGFSNPHPYHDTADSFNNPHPYHDTNQPALVPLQAPTPVITPPTYVPPYYSGSGGRYSFGTKYKGWGGGGGGGGSYYDGGSGYASNPWINYMMGLNNWQI